MQCFVYYCLNLNQCLGIVVKLGQSLLMNKYSVCKILLWTNIIQGFNAMDTHKMNKFVNLSNCI